MKTKLFSLLLAVAASVGTMFANGTTIGGLHYNLNEKNRTAEVTYDNLYGNYDNFTTFDIPATVKYNGKTYNVTRIGEKAFYGGYGGCKNLTSVTIPNSVTSIGHAAFYECKKLTSIEIPNSVTSIGESAFGGCSSLAAINVPNGITSIEIGTFADCSSLAAIDIPNSVTSIGAEAFRSCQRLNSIVIPDGVTIIDMQVFKGCYRLTSLTMGENVTEIRYGAFYGCSGLTSVTIPNSVTSIGDYAFYECSSLTSVTIPNGVPSIGEYTFGNCKKLTSIEIPNSVTSIGVRAFYGCHGLKSVTIPNSVTSIGEYAFGWCSSLTSVTIPNSVTSIGVMAFYYCSRIVNIYVCGDIEKYKQMLESSFDDMNIIKYLPLPYSVTITYSENGNVSYPQSGCDDMLLIATPNYGYHFTQWSDGSTDNPRAFELTSDTTFTAEFAKNTYTITTESATPEWGTTTGGQTAQYLDEIEITAIAYDGYRFVRWDDGDTMNPRTITVTQDVNYVASFEKNSTDIDATQSVVLSPQKIMRDGQVLIMRGGKMYNLQGVEVR